MSARSIRNFSTPSLAVLILTAICFASPTSAQTRGFPSIPTPTLAVDALLSHWQAVQDDLRTTVGPKRRPEFEFHLFARAVQGRDELEKFGPNHLPQRIILVMGGLQGSIESPQRFAMALSEALHNPVDTRMAVFGYPNDGSICESSTVFRDMLTDLHNRSPKTKVSIVAHSMGALVARHALEPVVPNTGNQLPFVDQLVMISPPNHGSVLAQYADALELPDALSKIQYGSLSFTEVMESLVNDGLGEACEELVPNSPFLQELNSRPRAEGVHYSIVTGTDGPITPLIRLASSIASKEVRTRTRLRRLPNAQDLLDRADELLLSDEFAQGLGDGAVSLQSASLPGVHEFIKVPISHGEWSHVDKPQVQTLVQKTSALLCRDQPLQAPARAKF
jgi:hypothetical protein